ncbi:phosphate ABC transporter substrate-binding protein PstS [Plebeiibacterium marinum]|uniref:Phosphate-binding protein n=1 Tax=Plebeiibacterium marinum TaxID=2992111 RepID=A0AAE3SJR7_9BACT|nr:phosphate ABC transporter substrate-binding protein PstS [Plebeiobacterium marinum]MCW3805703.1 phosphate ABC transporter substrate-binding protein PstS [Plebeiobacterium marinum]
MKKLLVVLLIGVVFASCQNGKQKSADSSSKNVTIAAAGATFPMPYYNMVIKNYIKEKGVLVTYGGIGSGGGIKSLKDKVVDFGATDAYLSDEKMAAMPSEIVHIPTCLGAVVIAYNLPGVEGLKLTDELLEGIFMGEITKWNDSKITANNAGLNLPDQAITFVHRSDGSGTTYIFSDYMSKISSKWADKVGKGKSLQWPVGIGAKGNPGVAGTIKSTEGSIGYIGSEYAFAQKIPVALLKNAAGNYIEPSIESISAAAQGAMPADTRVMLTNSNDANAYPISGFTWLILYKDQAYNGRSKAQALGTLEFLDWLISADAQAVAPKVNYAPLPEKAVTQAKTILRSVTYNGEALLK